MMTCRSIRFALALAACVAADSQRPAFGAGPPAPEADAAVQRQLLDQAATIGRDWMQRVQAGDLEGGLRLWGHHAFARTARAEVLASLTEQAKALGPLQGSGLLEERSLIDAEGQPETPGRQVTLRWFTRYAKAEQREFLVLHEPKGGGGLKIVGLRRQDLPTGKEGAVEMAADLGQAALLRLNGLTETRWGPFMDEAKAIARGLGMTLPALPEARSDAERERAGAAVVSYLMSDLNAPLEKLGEAGGMREARMILTSYAMLMLYTPGEETITRLGAVIGADGAKSGLPGALWQPVVKAVVDKEPAARVHELVQTMASDTAVHLREVETEQALRGGAKALLDKAFENMASLPSYEVRAEFKAGGRTARMEGLLTLEATEVRLTGFDGRRQDRVAGQDGMWLSEDGGKSWRADKDHETTAGLLRTLTAPVDPGFKVTSYHEFVLAGEEVVNGERLLHVRGRNSRPEDPIDYWVLISKAGPVIRRAHVMLSFGDLPAEAILTYTKLGRPVTITRPGNAGAAAPETATPGKQ